MLPVDFKWTQYYEEITAFTDRYAYLPLDLKGGEWPICSTIIDADNWSILTTRRLFTNHNGQLHAGYIDNSKNVSHGKFKGKQDRTLGTLKLADGAMIAYHIETGKASMVMIYGIRTRIRMQAGVVNQ